MGYSEAQYAIDGIISGLNGQAKTGLEPPNVFFSVVAGNQSAKIRFTATDTIIYDMVIASTKGVTIRRKMGSAPLDPNDGDLVGTYEGTELTSHIGNNPIIDSHLINNQRYFYRFFPYTGEMVYNYSSRNIISVVPKSSTIWGFHQDFSNLDPDSSITYIADAVGYVPAHHNADTGTVTNGTWDEWEWLNMNKPYVVSGGGRALYALDPNDFSKKLDGTASNIDSLSPGTGCFSWINKIYMKEEYSADGMSRDVYFSMDNTSPETSDFLPIGFEADEDEVLEGVWLPMFYGDIDGGIKPGTLPAYSDGKGPISNPAPNQFPNLKSIETKIKSGFGVNGYFLGGPIINVLRDILYLLYKSTDVRKHGGEGRIKANAIVVNHADTEHDGQFYGRNRTASVVNRMFYSEVLNSFQYAVIDPYIWVEGGPRSGSSGTANRVSFELQPYYKRQVEFKPNSGQDYSWNDIIDSGPVYQSSECGQYVLTCKDQYYPDSGMVSSELYGPYFNNGYAAYMATKTVMPTAFNTQTTSEEAAESGLPSTCPVSFDGVAGSVKCRHAKHTGSIVRIDAHGSAANANTGLCTAWYNYYSHVGFGMRFGGCSDYVDSSYTYTSPNDYDFDIGQYGGDYAGIAYLGTFGPQFNQFNTSKASSGIAIGYSILALPPSGYSPVEI